LSAASAASRYASPLMCARASASCASAGAAPPPPWSAWRGRERGAGSAWRRGRDPDAAEVPVQQVRGAAAQRHAARAAHAARQRAAPPAAAAAPGWRAPGGSWRHSPRPSAPAGPPLASWAPEPRSLVGSRAAPRPAAPSPHLDKGRLCARDVTLRQQRVAARQRARPGLRHRGWGVKTVVQGNEGSGDRSNGFCWGARPFHPRPAPADAPGAPSPSEPPRLYPATPKRRHPRSSRFWRGSAPGRDAAPAPRALPSPAAAGARGQAIKRPLGRRDCTLHSPTARQEAPQRVVRH
jgi:hypothetical protein